MIHIVFDVFLHKSIGVFLVMTIIAFTPMQGNYSVNMSHEAMSLVSKPRGSERASKAERCRASEQTNIVSDRVAH